MYFVGFQFHYSLMDELSVHNFSIIAKIIAPFVWYSNNEYCTAHTFLLRNYITFYLVDVLSTKSCCILQIYFCTYNLVLIK